MIAVGIYIYVRDSLQMHSKIISIVFLFYLYLLLFSRFNLFIYKILFIATS